jgi:anti-sigma factor RsiW
MTCRDVHEIADAYLAGELDQDTVQQLQRHLETCPSCRQELDSVRELRASVRGAFDRAEDLQVRPEFLTMLDRTLRSGVRPAGEAVPSSLATSKVPDATVAAPPPAHTTRYRWLALAAAVLIAAGIGVLWNRRASTADDLVARDAAGDHRDCALVFALAEKPIPLDDAARRYDAAFRVLEALPPDTIATPAGPAHVVARHSCVYHGRRFAHVVMQYRGTAVSLLVTARGGGDGHDRADGQLSVPNTESHPLTARAIDQLTVVSWPVGRHTILVVGDRPQPDLAALANAAAEPLSHRLADAAVGSILPLDTPGQRPMTAPWLLARVDSPQTSR